MTLPLDNNPWPRVHEIYNFDRPFLGRLSYLLSLSESCSSVYMKIFKEIMHFHHMSYMASPSTRTSGTGVKKLTIFEDPSSVIIPMFLHVVCLPRSREEDFERNNAFSLYDLYSHAPAKEPLHVGHEIYSFGRPFLGH